MQESYDVVCRRNWCCGFDSHGRRTVSSRGSKLPILLPQLSLVWRWSRESAAHLDKGLLLQVVSAKRVARYRLWQKRVWCRATGRNSAWHCPRRQREVLPEQVEGHKASIRSWWLRYWSFSRCLLRRIPGWSWREAGGVAMSMDISGWGLEGTGSFEGIRSEERRGWRLLLWRPPIHAVSCSTSDTATSSWCPERLILTRQRESCRHNVGTSSGLHTSVWNIRDKLDTCRKY